jgi:hypothetical protein
VRRWCAERIEVLTRAEAEQVERPAVLAEMRADALTAAGVADEGPEFVEPPADPKATLLAARAAAFEHLAVNRRRAELMGRIRAARLPMGLHALYAEYADVWTAAHSAAADEKLHGWSTAGASV